MGITLPLFGLALYTPLELNTKRLCEADYFLRLPKCVINAKRIGFHNVKKSGFQKVTRHLQDSNLRGQSPKDF